MNPWVACLTDADLAKQSFKHEPWILLYFWASWSGSCRFVSLFVENVARTYGDRLSVYTIDLDLNPLWVAHCQVSDAPTLVLLHYGEIVDTVAGALSRPQFEQMLAHHLQSPMNLTA